MHVTHLTTAQINLQCKFVFSSGNRLMSHFSIKKLSMTVKMMKINITLFIKAYKVSKRNVLKSYDKMTLKFSDRSNSQMTFIKYGNSRFLSHISHTMLIQKFLYRVTTLLFWNLDIIFKWTDDFHILICCKIIKLGMIIIKMII